MFSIATVSVFRIYWLCTIKLSSPEIVKYSQILYSILMKRVGLLISVVLCLAAVTLYVVHDHFRMVAADATTVRFNSSDDMPDPNQVFDMVNGLRAQSGLQPLSKNAVLAELAAQRAADMGRHNYYAHRDPNGYIFSDLLVQNGYNLRYGCENLDLEFSTSPLSYVNSWAQSPSHNACLLQPEVSAAGYAVTTIANKPGQPPTYVMVAIHGTTPTVAQ